MSQSKAAGLRRSVAATLGLARNDFAIWLRRPVAILTTLTPSIMYILVVYFISLTVGTPPVALVVQDSGPAAAQFASVIRASGGFVVKPASVEQASQQLQSLAVAAVITIPPSFDADLAAGRPDPVGFRTNDLNRDIADDLHRSFAAALADFYRQRPADPLLVRPVETDTHQQDISLAQFRIVPGLVLILTIAGIVNTGLATCQEFEGRTIKELTLAPIPTWTLIAGKIIGGWLTTITVGAVVFAVGAISGLLRPAGPYWLPAIGMSLLIGLAASCLGVATGAVFKKFQLVTSLSVAISLYLFFLSGGVSVPGFLPPVLADIGRYVPLYHGIRALERAVFDSSVSTFAFDTGILMAFAAANVVLSRWALRRRLVS